MSSAIMVSGGTGYPPEAFERAMVFVDGSNFFNRLREQRLKMASTTVFFTALCKDRTLVRVYVYSTQDKIDKAKDIHGEAFLHGCRVVLGDTITTEDGMVREKCVDALLVADLIYHAASRNCGYAVVLTNDSDFRHALKRVEDFGCKTALCAIGTHAPDRLRLECDDYLYFTKDRLKGLGAVDYDTLEGA